MIGPDRSPLLWLAMWKEFLLGVILIVAALEVLETLTMKNVKFKMDVLDWLVMGLVLLGVVIPSSNFIFGFKYTLFPLCLFFVLRRVKWSEEFKQRIMNVILVVGGIIAGYGILTFFLPLEFFTWLGYSDLHSLYVPDGPLAAFQQIGGTGIRRIQSTMSGPNQLGIWLLIPWSVAVYYLFRRSSSPDGGGLRWGGMSNGEFHLFSNPLSLTAPLRERGNLAFLLFLGLAIFFTFSRAAWVGAMVITVVAGWQYVSLKQGVKVFVAGCTVLVLFALIAPNVLLRAASTRGHFEKPLAAIQTMIDHPFGLGLGSAGPASNRVSDACVYLELDSDVSWAGNRPDLCVFVGDTQIQPANKICDCPFLSENWYLQIGVELGVVGLILFLILVVLIILRTWADAQLMFLGVSIAALFLHAWEDSATAYTMWMLLSSALLSFSSDTAALPGGAR